MQAAYEARFTREMGCTPAEFIAWLPGASRGAPIRFTHDGAELDLEGGTLAVTWSVLAPRRIALVTLPRLSVTFDFGEVEASRRHAFMKYFDLYTQRGGG